MPIAGAVQRVWRMQSAFYKVDDLRSTLLYSFLTLLGLLVFVL